MRLTEVQTQSMESDYGKWVGVENMLMEGVEKWSRKSPDKQLKTKT